MKIFILISLLDIFYYLTLFLSLKPPTIAIKATIIIVVLETLLPVLGNPLPSATFFSSLLATSILASKIFSLFVLDSAASSRGASGCSSTGTCDCSSTGTSGFSSTGKCGWSSAGKCIWSYTGKCIRYYTEKCRR